MEGFICVNLNSNQAVSLKNVFRGQDPSVVPVYVINREQNNFLHIAYWLFFPYNRGKRGLHWAFSVGSLLWEIFNIWTPCWRLGLKVTVRFRKVNTNYQIYSIYLSTRSQEITNKYVGEFLWQGGMFKKGSRTLGISMVVLMHSLLCLGFTWVLTES